MDSVPGFGAKLIALPIAMADEKTNEWQDSDGQQVLYYIHMILRSVPIGISYSVFMFQLMLSIWKNFRTTV